jgi:hypothetical protein
LPVIEGEKSMSYGEASFLGMAARAGYGFAEAGVRNTALEAWAFENDRRLITEARERAMADGAAPVAGAVEVDFASVDAPVVVEMPAPFEFQTAQIG